MLILEVALWLQQEFRVLYLFFEDPSLCLYNPVEYLRYYVPSFTQLQREPICKECIILSIMVIF